MVDQPSAISPEKLALYRATARQRAAEEAQRLHAAFARAWQVARTGAALLRTGYGATRVLVFGSLTDEALFHARSDIDLATEGIEESSYLRALADLLSLSPEFSFDLVRIEEASPSLRAFIEEQGQEL